MSDEGSREPTGDPATTPDEGPPPGDSAGAAKAAALLGAVFALVALGVSGPRAALSVLIGAAVAVANLLAMRAIARALVNPSNAGAGIAWALFAALKILLLFGSVWFLLTRRWVDPMPLVVGYGVLPLGIAASAVWSSLRSGRPS